MPAKPRCPNCENSRFDAYLKQAKPKFLDFRFLISSYMSVQVSFRVYMGVSENKEPHIVI